MNAQDVLTLLKASDEDLAALVATANVFPGLVAVTGPDLYRIRDQILKLRGQISAPGLNLPQIVTRPRIPDEAPITLPSKHRGGPPRRDKPPDPPPDPPAIESLPEPPAIESPTASASGPIVPTYTLPEYVVKAQDLDAQAEEVMTANPPLATMPPKGFRLESCSQCNLSTWALASWPPPPPSTCFQCLIPAGRASRKEAYRQELASRQEPSPMI